MTLLEFCKSFFPDEEIFSEQNGMLLVNTHRLLELEKEWKDKNHQLYYSVRPTDILNLIEQGNRRRYAPCPGACNGCRGETERLTLSEESTRSLKQFRLVIDPEVAGMDFDVRRPYFRMRGKPVTEEQAFEIIRRTDSFFSCHMDQYHVKDLVSGSLVLDNMLFYPFLGGWVRPDRVFGANDITGKYPNEEEFVYAMLSLMLAFPYLDLMIGVTDWNEGPPYAWDACFDMDDDDVFSREDYPDFEEHIVYGIWLHDGTLELMAPAQAREKYAEYNRLYSGLNEDIFKSHYYLNNNVHPADFEYLKRCIRSHGLDPEEILARYEWDPVTGLRSLGPTPEEQAEMEKRRAEADERIRQEWERGWNRMPEQIQALQREAQALMQEAGVSDWAQRSIWGLFVPAGFLGRDTPTGIWPDPPAEHIRTVTKTYLSEALQEKLIGIMARMKQEWDSVLESDFGGEGVRS